MRTCSQVVPKLARRLCVRGHAHAGYRTGSASCVLVRADYAIRACHPGVEYNKFKDRIFAVSQSVIELLCSVARSHMATAALHELRLCDIPHVVCTASSSSRMLAGFDSILAKGQLEPNPKQDALLTLGGQPVAVPQGPPVKQQDSAHSHFTQSEYLVYQEAQQCLRYVLTFQW